MSVLCVLFAALILAEAGHHSTHDVNSHRNARRHRAVVDGALRFEPPPYNKKLLLQSSGKIHCKVAGGVSPNIQWYLNDSDPLPEGVTSLNGTLLVTSALRHHSGQYTCRATEGDNTIEAKITLDVVVFPRVLEPAPGSEKHASSGQPVWIHCTATGEPNPTTHWDRNLTTLHQQQEDVDLEDGPNASTARMILFNNGTLFIRKAREDDSDRYGCTAGSAAGFTRNELLLVVHPEGEPLPGEESAGVAGKAVIVSISVAGAYMVLVLVLMVYCRKRRLRRRERGEKMELEMAEGREKLVEGEEDKKIANGAPLHNGRLLPHERDSGADNSEVSGISRASKKSGQYDHLTIPRTLLTEMITLGRGEFGDVMLAKIDMSQLKKLRNKDDPGEAKIKPVLVKALTAKDEIHLTEFRRQLDLFSRVRHTNVVRLLGLCNEQIPHFMLLEHTDWGDLKNFLIATRTPEETAEYIARINGAHPLPNCGRVLPALQPVHQLVLATHLAHAGANLANKRLIHKDIAARNCVITSQLQLKLSYAALTKGPDSFEYYKLHDQVIPLRWLPLEAVMEADFSTKSDVYMFASTVWEIYTKAELPFAKLNDNSVLERLKAGTLEWSIPTSMPDKLAQLLKRCWSKSPADRPQFSDICEELSAILKEVTAVRTPQQSQENINEE